MNEDRLKVQLSEFQKKEQYHIMRLATKEHEIQELGVGLEVSFFIYIKRERDTSQGENYSSILIILQHTHTYTNR